MFITIDDYHKSSNWNSTIFSFVFWLLQVENHHLDYRTLEAGNVSSFSTRFFLFVFFFFVILFFGAPRNDKHKMRVKCKIFFFSCVRFLCLAFCSIFAKNSSIALAHWGIQSTAKQLYVFAMPKETFKWEIRIENDWNAWKIQKGDGNKHRNWYAQVHTKLANENRLFCWWRVFFFFSLNFVVVFWISFRSVESRYNNNSEKKKKIPCVTIIINAEKNCATIFKLITILTADLKEKEKNNVKGNNFVCKLEMLRPPKSEMVLLQWTHSVNEHTNTQKKKMNTKMSEKENKRDGIFCWAEKKRITKIAHFKIDKKLCSGLC